MFHIALLSPQIAPNTGNIIRLCANCGASLHLIHPLGFELDDRRMKRAGLDYHEFAAIAQHDDWAAFSHWAADKRVFGLSTRGQRNYCTVKFEAEDILLFGSETQGLPQEIRDALDDRLLRLPMRPGNRSLNLANAVSIVAYEAWRQMDFACQ